MIILQAIRYLLLFPFAFAMSLAGILFSPVIALFVDDKGNLPYLLRWFQTPDATMFDVQWVAEHPTWSKYHIAQSWCARNPAYGFLQWIGVGRSLSYTGYGNVDCDSSNSLGAALFIANNGFQINIVWKLPLVSWCIIHSFGWNIKSSGLTAGAYIMSPIRFYNYTGK